MTNLKLPNLSYASLKTITKKKIAYATTLLHHHDNDVTIYHHGNPIATFSEMPDGTVKLTVSNCGYHSKTTAHRLTAILQDNGVKGLGPNASLLSAAIKDYRMVYRERDTLTGEVRNRPFEVETFTLA